MFEVSADMANDFLDGRRALTCHVCYNKADREATARLAERQRLEEIDPPIQKTRSATPSSGAVLQASCVGPSVRSPARSPQAPRRGAAMQKAREAGRA